LVQAYDANLLEDAAKLGAHRRGVSVKDLEKTAKSYTMNLRCAKACFGESIDRRVKA